MPFLIPLAGLALGALGRLISNRRSQSALSAASTSGSQEASRSETGLSTAASGITSLPTGAPILSGQTKPQTTLESQGFQENSGDEASRAASPLVRQPATGPVQQNKGTDTPTPGGDAGLAARLGRESVEASKKKNREQTAISNAALQ